MTRSLEYGVFLALALLLHLAAFVLYDRPEAPDGGGGSTDAIAVASASGQIAELIAAWDAPPETSAAPWEATAPDAHGRPRSDAAPAPPRPVETPAARAADAVPREPPPSPLGRAEIALPPVLAPTMLEPLPLPDKRPGPPEQTVGEVNRPDTVSLPEKPDELAPPPAIPAREPTPTVDAEVAPRLSLTPPARPRQETAQSKPPVRQPARQDQSTQRPVQEGSGSAVEAASTAPSAEAAQQRSSDDGAALEAFLDSAGDAGSATSAPAAARTGPPPSQLASLERRFGAAIRAAIERRKTYPRRARARRIEGVATLRVTISRQGRLLTASLARSSGHTQLDQAALSAARSVGIYPAAPADLPGASFSFVVPMAFRLR